MMLTVSPMANGMVRSVHHDKTKQKTWKRNNVTTLRTFLRWNKIHVTCDSQSNAHDLHECSGKTKQKKHGKRYETI